MAVDPDREVLAERIRTALRGKAAIREVAMFGGLSFMVSGKITVAARKKGDLLVHVDADRSEALLSRPGARIAQMGTRRSMGPSWLEVDAKALKGDALAFWINTALDLNARSS